MEEKIIHFVPSKAIISKLNVKTTEQAEALLRKGCYLSEEIFKQVISLLKDPKIILESDEPRFNEDVQLGAELQILSMETKIRFQKGWFYLSDFIHLINQGRLKLTIVL